MKGLHSTAAALLNPARLHHARHRSVAGRRGISSCLCPRATADGGGGGNGDRQQQQGGRAGPGAAHGCCAAAGEWASRAGGASKAGSDWGGAVGGLSAVAVQGWGRA